MLKIFDVDLIYYRFVNGTVCSCKPHVFADVVAFMSIEIVQVVRGWDYL